MIFFCKYSQVAEVVVVMMVGDDMKVVAGGEVTNGVRIKVM